MPHTRKPLVFRLDVDAHEEYAIRTPRKLAKRDSQRDSKARDVALRQARQAKAMLRTLEA